MQALATAHPDNAELKTGKALLLQQEGKREEALALAREVLADNPTSTHALLIETRLLQELGREGEAFDRLEQIVADNPFNRRLRLQYARLLTSTDLEKARQQFEILVQQTPHDPDLLLSLALISRETGALEESRRYFEQLLDMGQRVGEAHYYLGQLAEQRDERAAALSHYEQIPPGAEFLPGVGRALQLLLADDDIEGARHYLAEQRARHPQQEVRLYMVESELLMQRRAYAAGAELLTEALAAYPDHPNLLYARSLFSEKLGNLPELERDLRRILERDPGNVHALNALGYSLANLSDRLDEAYDLIRRAHEQKPDDPAILDSLGWIEYRRGHLDTALGLLRRAYAAFPDGEVAAHLGEVLWALDRRDEAMKLWLEALKQDPESPVLRETLQRHGKETADNHAE
jgi:tetratricopeptide (TPR) repeat protein